jgi:hypothetical protein
LFTQKQKKTIADYSLIRIQCPLPPKKRKTIDSCCIFIFKLGLPTWSPEKVCEWLSSLDQDYENLYSPLVEKNEINGENLFNFNQNELKYALEIDDKTHLYNIWDALQRLRLINVTYLI